MGRRGEEGYPVEKKLKVLKPFVLDLRIKGFDGQNFCLSKNFIGKAFDCFISIVKFAN